MVVFEQRGVGDRLEPQLVGGVRGVRHELAQEDFLIAVERMDHQVEELLDLRLEPECFACRCSIHADIVATAAGRLARPGGIARRYGAAGVGRLDARGWIPGRAGGDRAAGLSVNYVRKVVDATSSHHHVKRKIVPVERLGSGHCES